MTAHCGILELSISSQYALGPLHSLILPVWGASQVLSLQPLLYTRTHTYTLSSEVNRLELFRLVSDIALPGMEGTFTS